MDFNSHESLVFIRTLDKKVRHSNKFLLLSIMVYLRNIAMTEK